MLLKDARDYQILFLSLFLILGIGTRDWTLRTDLMAVTIGSCLVTQWILVSLVPYIQGKMQLQWSSPPKSFLTLLPSLSTFRSAAITSLGLCLLLRGNNYHTMALAGCLAIASKFLFQYKDKHFFNPANFGIIAALLLTKDAWISPGQWGTYWWYLLLFAGTGGMILKRVGRWDTSAAFFLSYAVLEALRNFWLGFGWDVLIHELMSGSLLLFALFMLTDPRSIPNATMSRLIWAVGIALLTFILQHQFFVESAIFWALFAISPLTIFLDEFWSAPRFTWQQTKLAIGSR